MDKKQQFQQGIKQALDRQGLDRDTEIALREARFAALDNDSRSSRGRWIPATALSVIALVAVVVFMFQGVNDIELPQVAADDLAVIASEDEFELYEELEFYLWLDEDQKV